MLVLQRIGRRQSVAMVLAAALAGVSFLAWSWLGVAADPPAKAPGGGAEAAPNGWTTAAPRDEIRPEFGYDPKGGLEGEGCFTIVADRREGLDGWWKKSFAVTGGKHYRFAASFQAKGVTGPRRGGVAELARRGTAR